MKRFLLTITFLFFYSITVHTQILNDSCYQAIEVFCGEEVEVNLGGYRIDPFSVNDCNYSTNYANVWYKIIGTGEVVYLSHCSTSISIKIFQGSCDDLACQPNVIYPSSVKCSSYSSEEAKFETQIGVEYYILCVSYSSPNPSTLEISCVEPPENNICAQAIDIEVDSNTMFNHDAATNSNFIGCINYNDNSPDTWYTFTGTGEMITLTYPSDQSRPLARLYKGSCEQFQCVNSFSVGYKITYETEEEETYYLQVISNRAEDQYFTLTTVDLAENDECDQAITFMARDTLEVDIENTKQSQPLCYSGYNNDVWFKFIGNDSILNLSSHNPYSNYDIKLLEGNCESFTCMNMTVVRNGTEYAIFTEKDKEYYVNIRSSPSSGNNNITTFASTPLENDTYANAPFVSCQDTFRGTLEGALHDYPIIRRYNPSVWYKIIGTGDFYTSSAMFPGYDSYYYPYVHFYQKQEDNLVVYGNAANSVFLEKDSLYYINVYSQSIVAPFWIKFNCVPNAANDVCGTAQTVNFQDTIQGELKYATTSGLGDCSDRSFHDVWYKIEGDGSLRDIFFERGSNSRYEFDVYKGACDEWECVPDEYISYSYNSTALLQKRYFFEEETTYYIKLHSYYNTTPNYFYLLYFAEYDISENDICDKAIMLHCGTTIRDSLDFAVDNEVGCNDSNNTSYTTEPSIWYKLEGMGRYYELATRIPDYGYRINAENFLLYEGDCGELRCINDQLSFKDGKLIFFAENGKNYYLTYQNSRRYDIEITTYCYDYIDNDLAIEAKEIQCNRRYYTYKHDATYSDGNLCDEGNAERKDIWFRITGKGEFLYYQNNLNNNGRIEGAYVREGNTLICYDLFYQERIFLQEGVEYYLRYIFNNPSDTYVKYDLLFDCHPILENDECISAMDLSCGDDFFVDNTYATDDKISDSYCYSSRNNRRQIWYKIEGDDMWKTISITGLSNEDAYEVNLYRGNCDNLICTRGDKIFFAEKGQSYYVEVFKIYGSYWENMNISVTCSSPLVNDLCENATSLICGDTLEASLDYAINCDESDTDICGTGYISNRRIWYNIIGTGQIQHLKLLSENSYYNRNHYIEVYEEDCCIKERLEKVYGGQNDLYFYGEENQIYLVAIRSTFSGSLGNFKLVNECLENNDEQNFTICENANQLTPYQEDTLSLSKSTSYYNPSYHRNDDRAYWVQFEGSGGLDTIEIEHSGIYSITTYDYIDLNNNCDLMHLTFAKKLHERNNNDKTTWVISTLKRRKYVLGLIGSYYNSESSIQVTLKPAKQLQNCNLVLPDPYVSEYGYQSRIPLNITTANGIFDLNILDDVSKTSRTFYSDIIVGESFTIPSFLSGTKVIEFDGNECYGHNFFNVQVDNAPPPENPCTDTVAICLEEIEHFDRELADSTFKAFTIESNSIISYASNVQYQAGEEVLLLPGFETEDESDFTAVIIDCIEEENTEAIEERSIEKEAPMILKSGLDLAVAPNPFSGNTNIHYRLSEHTELTLSLYSTQGKLVRSVLTRQLLEAGDYQMTLEDYDLKAGLYFLVLRTTEKRIVRKVVVLDY